MSQMHISPIALETAGRPYPRTKTGRTFRNINLLAVGDFPLRVFLLEFNFSKKLAIAKGSSLGGLTYGQRKRAVEMSTG